MKTKTMIKPIRQKNSRPKKLTQYQIDEIVLLYNQGVPQKDIAEKFHVSRTTVSRYIAERRDSHS